MLFVVVGVAGILVVSYLALDYVFTQYKHTNRSRGVLLAEALVCLLLAVFLAVGLPGLPWYFSGALGFAAGLLAYSALALITVETWRRMAPAEERSGDFGSLQHRMQSLQEEYEDVVREINELNRRKKALEREHDEELFRQRKLENDVHRWQGGGGMERIRSLRVEDWTRELSDLSESQLEATCRRLEERAEEEAPDKEEALRIRACLTELELIRRGMREPNRELAEMKRALDEAEGRKGALAAEIHELDRDLRAWNRGQEEDPEEKVELK